MNTYKENPQQVFQDAIDAGILSIHESESNFAGNYMYMHTEHMGDLSRDAFKHIDTRNYYFTSWSKQSNKQRKTV